MGGTREFNYSAQSSLANVNYTERETVRACVCACVCLYLDRKRKCHMGGARGVALVWTNNGKPPCRKSPTRERAQNDTISRPRSSATLASAHDEHVNIRASAGISCRIMIAQKRWINMQNNKMPRPNRLSACAFAFRERKKSIRNIIYGELLRMFVASLSHPFFSGCTLGGVCLSTVCDAFRWN